MARYGLASLAMIMGCASAACSPQAMVDAGAQQGSCTTGFLGDAGAPDFEMQTLLADGAVAAVEDGGPVPMLLPPQGGRVIFVGVRATHIDGCHLQLTGALRDPLTRQATVDSRTIDLIPTGDGWGASVASTESISAAITNFSNIPVCPDNWGPTSDVYGHPYGLEVTLRDREGRTRTKTSQVIPECAQPENLAECLCICKAGYVTGMSCPDAGGASDASASDE